MATLALTGSRRLGRDRSLLAAAPRGPRTRLEHWCLIGAAMVLNLALYTVAALSVGVVEEAAQDRSRARLEQQTPATRALLARRSSDRRREALECSLLEPGYGLVDPCR